MYFFLFLGLFFLFFCVNELLNQIKFSENKVKTVGQIISISERIKVDIDGDSSVLFYPVIEFHDLSGKKVEFECLGSSPCNLKKGQTIAVEYDKNKPINAVIKSWWRRWLSLSISLLLSVMFLYIGLADSNL